MNEFLLIALLLTEFTAILAAYRLFGKAGLYAMTAFCAVAANIEVAMLIDAFSIEQTLGNTLFAASFLITDILSENEGKKAAQRAVGLGIFISVLFLIVSQSWLLFVPSANDIAGAGFKTVFSSTPRILLSSVMVYAVSQRLDVILYHRIWQYTERKFGDAKRFMFLRNNLATLVSQLINTILFNVGAFAGTYSADVMVTICISSYLIFIATSLIDTPFLYLARRMKEKSRVGA